MLMPMRSWGRPPAPQALSMVRAAAFALAGEAGAHSCTCGPVSGFFGLKSFIRKNVYPNLGTLVHCTRTVATQMRLRCGVWGVEGGYVWV